MYKDQKVTPTESFRKERTVLSFTNLFWPSQETLQCFDLVAFIGACLVQCKPNQSVRQQTDWFPGFVCRTFSLLVLQKATANEF